MEYLELRGGEAYALAVEGDGLGRVVQLYAADAEGLLLLCFLQLF